MTKEQSLWVWGYLGLLAAILVLAWMVRGQRDRIDRLQDQLDHVYEIIALRQSQGECIDIDSFTFVPCIQEK